MPTRRAPRDLFPMEMPRMPGARVAAVTPSVSAETTKGARVVAACDQLDDDDLPRLDEVTPADVR